ncbi:MAG: hypothetical protein K8H88_10365, partial [Sandaracinaceae bacterium]|nr:hypothetical protein [Sandaracinaceae bacterium]
MTAPEVVSTGDWGLDLVLGGGVRLLSRVEGREPSATLLVRGGPGAGKTTLGYQLATQLAAARGGDVAYGCVELWPAELEAQRDSIWGAVGKKQSSPARATFESPPFRKSTSDGVRVFASVLAIEPGSEGAFDAFGESLDALLGAAREVGGRPRVLVVDSLSLGYGLSNAPRELIDAVVKLAVREGLVLLLLEEGLPADRSEWAYAVDTVIELDHLERAEPAAQLERKLWVVKNRFGPSVHGPHRYSLLQGQGARVFPAPISYSTPWAHSALELPSRAQIEQRLHSEPALSWELDFLTTEMRAAKSPAWPLFEDCSVLVTSPDAEIVQLAARRVGAVEQSLGADLWIDLSQVDTSQSRLPTQRQRDWVVGLGGPYLSSQRLVFIAMDALRQFAAADRNSIGVRRVLIGDASVLRGYVAGADELRRGLVTLLAALRRAELPVVLFETAASTTMGERTGMGEHHAVSTGAPLPALAHFVDAVLQILPSPTSDPRDPA